MANTNFVNLKWHGFKVATDFKENIRRKIQIAVTVLERAVKEELRKGGRSESGMTRWQNYIGRGGTKRRRRVDDKTGARLGRTGSFHSKADEPPRTQTGTLRRSIESEVVTDEMGWVGTNVKYAPMLEFGTKPHKIRAKRTMYLAKRVGTKGWIFFGEKVNHPGFKPRPFFRPAMMRVRPALVKLFAKKWG